MVCIVFLFFVATQKSLHGSPSITEYCVCMYTHSICVSLLIHGLYCQSLHRCDSEVIRWVAFTYRVLCMYVCIFHVCVSFDACLSVLCISSSCRFRSDQNSCHHVTEYCVYMYTLFMCVSLLIHRLYCVSLLRCDSDVNFSALAPPGPPISSPLLLLLLLLGRPPDPLGWYSPLVQENHKKVHDFGAQLFVYNHSQKIPPNSIRLPAWWANELGDCVHLRRMVRAVGQHSTGVRYKKSAKHVVCNARSVLFWRFAPSGF